MRAQFLELLKDIGFLSSDTTINNITLRYENRNGKDRGMLGSVLCAGLAPNILQIPYSSRSVITGIMPKKIMETGLYSKRGTYVTDIWKKMSFVIYDSINFLICC